MRIFAGAAPQTRQHNCASGTASGKPPPASGCFRDPHVFNMQDTFDRHFRSVGPVLSLLVKPVWLWPVWPVRGLPRLAGLSGMLLTLPAWLARPGPCLQGALKHEKTHGFICFLNVPGPGPSLLESHGNMRKLMISYVFSMFRRPVPSCMKALET